MPRLKSLLPFPADSPTTVGHLRRNCLGFAAPEPLLHTNIWRTSLTGSPTEPVSLASLVFLQEQSSSLFLSWAPLILASGWKCLTATSYLLNKTASAERKSKALKRQPCQGEREDREPGLSDEKFLCRKDSWVCLGMGTLDDPQKWRVRTIALPVMIAQASLWEIFSAYHFHNTIQAWHRGI